ncbi:PIF-0 [Aratus pisonii nudivirus]|nr:PIF-0 [Aratus pisonii nudivirus]
MSYTNKDLDNGITYSNNRYTLSVINAMYNKMPHLISHMEYSIEQADPDEDYYYPASFQKRAIKVTTNIPETLCLKLSCNSVMENSACTKNTPASYYIIGDQADFRRRCEPSCFHLLKDPVIDEETGEEQVQMLRLEYNTKFGCIIAPTASIWHEYPFYRSETVYEHRLNDLPVGFNLDTPDPYSYSGMAYKYNKSYCDAFYDQWDGTTCIKQWWEIVLYAVVGESIVKMVKAGITSINNGYKSDYPDITLPTTPDIEDVWTVKGWEEDINTEFIVPPVEYEIPTSLVGFIQRETEHTNNVKLDEKYMYQKNIKMIKNIKNKQKQISFKLRRKLESNFDIKILNNEDHHEINSIKYNNKKYKSKIIFISHENGDQFSILDLITDVVGGLLASVFDPNFWLDIGIGITSDLILDQIKIIFRKIANDIIPKLTEKILAYTGKKIMTKVFTKTLYATVANTISKIVIKSVSKVMIQITKLLAELASVVGIILAIITIFDILLTIWDPLGFNQKFDEEVINSVTRSSDIAMRQALEVSIPLMTFEIFTNMSLSAEEILDESLNTFIYVYEYLDALTVNAEGSRIDKGEEIIIGDESSEDISSSINSNIVSTKLVTPKELYDYEFEHNQRMRYFTVSSKFTISMFTISVIFMIMEIWFMAVICFIVVILSLFVTYLNNSTLNIGKLLANTRLLTSIFII